MSPVWVQEHVRDRLPQPELAEHADRIEGEEVLDLEIASGPARNWTRWIATFVDDESADRGREGRHPELDLPRIVSRRHAALQKGAKPTNSAPAPTTRDSIGPATRARGSGRAHGMPRARAAEGRSSTS